MSPVIQTREVLGCVDRSLGIWRIKCATLITVNGSVDYRESAENVASAGFDIRRVVSYISPAFKRGAKALGVQCDYRHPVSHDDLMLVGKWVQRHPEAHGNGKRMPGRGRKGMDSLTNGVLLKRLKDNLASLRRGLDIVRRYNSAVNWSGPIDRKQWQRLAKSPSGVGTVVSIVTAWDKYPCRFKTEEFRRA